MKIGSAGAAMAAAGFGFDAAASPEDVAQGPGYRKLGRTGMTISVISMGAMKTAEPAVFQAGFDRGINYIDTARVYMGGKNEQLVGQALKGYRDKVYVATKVKPGSKDAMARSVDESLDALGLDYVDLLQLHNIKSGDSALNVEYREVFAEARKQGKTRFIGVTTHTNEVEVMNAVIDDPGKFWDTILVRHNYKSDPAVKDAIARAAQANIGVIAMKTQMGGYRTKELGDISPHQAALKWVLQDPNVTAAIPGMLDMAQLTEALGVMEMKLTRQDCEVLERYAQAIAPYYCHGCSQCQATCPARVNIPKVNRSLMYAEGYRDLALARATYAEIPIEVSAAACGDCAQCVARCPHGLDIRERMSCARRILA